MTFANYKKKINKLVKNPNLFFYDYFRKKIFSKTSETTKKVIEKAQEPINPMVNILEINEYGVPQYLIKHLNCSVGPEDGFDRNGLLLWSGYLNHLVDLLSNIKNSMSMDLTLYTLGGGYSLQVPNDKDIDTKNVVSKLRTRPDFVIELSNALGHLTVIHFYLYDINEDGFALIRSNRALIRKIAVEDIPSAFPINKNSYDEKIDAVYTWVNQADIKWQVLWKDTYPENDFDPDRFTSNDELKYSLRSLNKYAPWLNKIYIVSNCSIPEWLELNEKIVWIDHKDIFPSSDMLPTFNSHAIECCLHRIPGISEKFIYLNDDFVFSQPCLPSDFYDETGRSISYFESYGMVNNASTVTSEVDYILASLNSNKILQKIFPAYNARNLHRHVPYALKKSVLEKIEKTFSENFELTRSAKVRSKNDINLTSFLYHHFALASGESVKSDLASMIVRPENIKPLLTKDAFKYKILCFNDGNGSAVDGTYKKQTIEFFNKRLKEQAPWEVKTRYNSAQEIN